ncbi:MAG: hypothetical protein LBD67_03830 [Candidatus Accumulibacter sp.]|jgi:hypothetical protein|nr:hypothetical protein [Accumulibacter sp.]
MRRAASNFIGIRPSRRLSVLLILLHSLAAASVVSLPWPVWIRVLLIALAGFSAFRSIRAFSVTELVFSPGKKRLSVRTSDGKRRDVSVMDGSTFFPRLIVLKLKFDDDGAVDYLTLLPDQMRTEDFRRLNLWLRWTFSS